MKEEKPSGSGGVLGMVAAMGAMVVCCGAMLLIGSIGAIGIGSVMAFASDALPVSAVLIIGGLGFLRYRSYVKQNRENRDVSSESQKSLNKSR